MKNKPKDIHSIFIVSITLCFLFSSKTSALEGVALVRDTTKLFFVNCATGDREEIVSSDDLGGACFSPNGKRIAYVKDNRIYVTDGPNKSPVSLGRGGHYINLGWDINGYIYWADGMRIYRVPVEGGERKLVHRINTGENLFHWGGVSVCGTRAAARTIGLVAIDLINRTDGTIGGGCNASISSDGMRGGNFYPSHGAVQFFPFDTAEIEGYKLISFKGMGGYTAFSRSSPDHIMVYIVPSSIDKDVKTGAYIIDIHSEKMSYIGSGYPLDYRPSTGSILLPIVNIADTVRFFAEKGKSATITKELTVTNDGAGTMRLVEAATNAAWLDVSRCGKANAQKLQLTVDTSAVANGIYSTRLTVHCANAVSQDTVMVILSLGVQTGPVLSLSSEEVTISGMEGGSNPETACIAVKNAGTGTLGNLTVQKSASWLTTKITGSGNDFSICNNVNLAGLKAGTYTDKITINAAGATASSAYAVKLTIEGDRKPATIVAMPESLVIGPGQSATIAAEVRDSSGVSIDDAPIKWFLSTHVGSISDDSGPTTVYTAPNDAPHQLTLEARSGYVFRYIRIRVDSNAVPFISVLAPRQGLNCPPDSTIHIEWTTNLVDRVNLSYSLNNGKTWITIGNYSVNKGDDKWGKYPWKVEGEPGDTCKIKITDYNGNYPAYSGWFVVRDNISVHQNPMITIAPKSPNIVNVCDIMGRVRATGFSNKIDVILHDLTPGYYVLLEYDDAQRCISKKGIFLSGIGSPMVRP